jgi:nicotinate-nucleotide pyrophosphorylase (carboxylating)
VETKNLEEVREALAAKADIIMLDNMPIDMMREAVKLIAGRALVEASGNVTLETIRAIAETGVDFVSSGSLTHSAPAADISMKIK